MATLSPADEVKIAALHLELETQILELPEEARLTLFAEIIRQYCTRCGKKQPDKDFCKCGLATR